MVFSAKSKLQDFGFLPSKADTSLFLYNKFGVTIFVLIYVDDIIVISSSDHAISALLKDLNAHFAIKDLGDLHFFLGIEVKRTADSLLLTQAKYAHDLLAKVGMLDCKSAPTPLSPSEPLSLHEGTLLGPEDSSQYRSIVGALQYLTLTHPDVFFRLTRSVNTFMLPLLLIGLQLNAYFVMLKIHLSLVSPSENLLLHFLVPFQMLIGQDALRIDAPLEVLLFS
jgi:histone deacetylase 1/2